MTSHRIAASTKPRGIAIWPLRRCEIRLTCLAASYRQDCGRRQKRGWFGRGWSPFGLSKLERSLAKLHCGHVSSPFWKLVTTGVVMLEEAVTTKI